MTAANKLTLSIFTRVPFRIVRQIIDRTATVPRMSRVYMPIPARRTGARPVVPTPGPLSGAPRGAVTSLEGPRPGRVGIV